MLKLVHSVGFILRWATGLSFAVLMVAVLVQVFMRTFSSGGSPVWTEEVTRYALLYVAGFGAGASLWTGAMVNVDLLSEHLPGHWPWRLRLLSALAVLFFAVILIEPAWRFTKIGMMQTSPSMPFVLYSCERACFTHYVGYRGGYSCRRYADWNIGRTS